MVNEEIQKEIEKQTEEKTVKEDQKEDAEAERPLQSSMVEQARNLNDELNKKIEELKREREAMDKAAAEMILGGKSFTGQRPEPKKEMSPIEKADAFQRGEFSLFE